MEPTKSNLEPIEESDLNLEGKFRGETTENHQETAKPFAVEREMPQEISVSEKDSAYSNILSKVQANPAQDFDPATVASDAQTAAQMTDSQSQIQHLVDIAQQKGVVHAVKVARHMEDNYVLDQLHDKLLAEELHNALVAKGMIKEL